MSARRDPETGQFVSTDEIDFDRFEEFHWEDLLSIPAADLDGTTGVDGGEQGLIEGRTLYDFDAGLDRDELGILMWAEHTILAYITSTATADGTVRYAVEPSATTDRALVQNISGSPTDIAEDNSTDFAVEAGGAFPDGIASNDIIGRTLHAVGYGPITDGTNGVGGAGTAGQDWWEGQPAAAPSFDARDEFHYSAAIEVANVSDAAAQLQFRGRHVVGVMEDFF